MEWLTMDRWSPYAVGIGIGVLSWLAFLFSARALGCSTAFSRTSGMIERLFRGRKVLDKAYYRRVIPTIEWGWMLVLGMVIGSFLSAWLSGVFDWVWVPQLWTETFGSSPLPRMATAFVGGILMGLGSRWAGGCTSGHGISGTLQLVLNSWLATICFFLGGVGSAMLIFRLLAG